MRIGATVLFNGEQCIQSYSWRRYRPLGNLDTVIRSLDEYRVDEISLIMPFKKLVDLKLYEKIKDLNSQTPVSLGGGIRHVNDLVSLKKIPFERLLLNSAFLDKDLELIIEAQKILGRQAVIAVLPVKLVDNNFLFYNSGKDKFQLIDEEHYLWIDDLANEILIIDVEKEGLKINFDLDILSFLPINNSKIIISGGISEDIVKVAYQRGIAAVHIDNWTLHRENSIESFARIR